MPDLSQKTYQDLEDEAKEQPFDIVEEQYMKMGYKTTVCTVVCRCGLEVVGTANCVNPDEYNIEIGKGHALMDAKQKIKEYRGVVKHVN